MSAKRFFYVCAGLMCLACAYHLGAATAQAQGGKTLSVFDVIKTRHLAIVDEHGRARAHFACEQGSTSLLLGDAEGALRASVTVKRDGTPVVSLKRADGRISAMLTMTDGGPSLAFTDAQGHDRMLLSLEGDGTPTLAMLDEGATARAVMVPSCFTLMDEQKRVRWRVPQ